MSYAQNLTLQGMNQNANRIKYLFITYHLSLITHNS